MIRDYYLDKISEYNNVRVLYNARIQSITRENDSYCISLQDGKKFSSSFIVNTTYASTNQISDLAGLDKFKIKYEMCEVILCEVSSNLKDVGITLMDGPFFSVMPFGKTGLHSLTSVMFTPHQTSYDDLPTFDCQDGEFCSSKQLNNCNLCHYKPETAWNYMHALARKFLIEDIKITYNKSLFSIKPILLTSELDDSRPTVIRHLSDNPTFISVLSGKINTIYDLDDVLDNKLLQHHVS